jgi:hypothetical protein
MSHEAVAKLLDAFVHEQLARRFGVLCTRLGGGKLEQEEAIEDFKDAVDLIYRARAIALDAIKEVRNENRD